MLRKAGFGLKFERATASNSRPSPAKSVSTNCAIVPSVKPVPFMAVKSARTWPGALLVGLSTNVFESEYS